MIPFRRIGFVLALFGAGQAHSQGLTLDSLIRAGLRNNSGLLEAREEIEGAASDTLNATMAPNPHLEVEGAHNLTSPDRPTASARLSREFQPGVRSGQYKASKAGLEAKRQWRTARELEVIGDIREGFHSWQVLNRKAQLQRETQQRWEKLSRLAAAKVKEGRLSQVDETEARLNLAKARQHELALRAEMGSVAKRLALLTGSGSLADSIAPALLDSLPPAPPLETLIPMAVRESPELKAQELEAEAQRRQVELEQAMGNPSFTLSVGYEREGEGENLIGAGIGLPLPLFNRNQAGIAKARSAVRSAGIRKAAAETRLANEIAEIHGRLTNLAERYRNYGAEIKSLSLKQLELSEKGFVQGMLGLFDLSRVQEEYLAREQEALDILEEYYRQWNRLGKAVGGKTW